MAATDVEMTGVENEDVKYKGRLIVSIDFGTVYSKAAWMTVETDTFQDELRRDQFNTHSIHDIRFHDDSGLPTEMAYHRDRWHYGSDVNALIENYEIPVSSRIKLFKLGLAEATHTRKITARLDKQIKSLPRDSGVTDRLSLVTVFLREFARQVRQRIFDVYGTENVLESYDVETLLTIPACWKPDMVVKMKTAAKEAGLQRVKLVSEPEAAAMWIKYNQPGSHGPLDDTHAESSKPFLLLDVGGGTADVVTYRIENGMLQQGVAGAGDLCGAAQMNEAFSKLLLDIWKVEESKICKEYLEGMEGETSETAMVSILNECEMSFEKRKGNFDFHIASGSSFYSIKRLRGNYPHSNIRMGVCRVPNYQIGNIFKIFIREVTRLVHRQIKAFRDENKGSGQTINHIYFVGGPSKNERLVSELRNDFDDVATVSTARDNARNLIAKGAIIQHLREDTIGERALPFSLGVEMDEDFSPVLHKQQRKTYVDPYDGARVVPRRLRWLFALRQKVRDGDVREARGSHDLPLVRGDFTMEQAIFYSESTNADHIPLLDPAGGLADGIYELCHVRIRLTEEDRQAFRKDKIFKLEDGRKYFRVDYLMRVMYKHPDMQYELFIPRSGKAAVDQDWDDTMCFKAEKSMGNLIWP